MIDPGTGLTALGIALGGKDIIVKLLGPTAEYIGNETKDFTKKRFENIKNIFSNGAKKLGSALDAEGGVSPKVLRGIINEGSFCDDGLAVEYFGGVLASSKTGISRDDRGAYFVSLINRLSTYQLRAHYLFYQLLKANFDGEKMNIGHYEDRDKMELFVPLSTYYEAMDFTREEMENAWNLMGHAIWGLRKEDLIGDHFRYGDAEFFKTAAGGYKGATEPGIIFSPTNQGVELFMWAYGLGQLRNNDFFSKEIVFNNDQGISIGRSSRTKTLPTKT